MKGKKSFLGTATLLIGLLILALLTLVSTSFNVTNVDLSRSTVYLPVFTNTECGVIDNAHVVNYDFAEEQNSDGWVEQYCSADNHNVYTDRCEIELFAKDNVFYGSYVTDLYKCPKNTDFSDRNTDCEELTKVAGGISFTRDEKLFIRARDNFGFGKVEKGDLEYNIVADWYGLKTIDSNNFLSKDVTCDVSRLVDSGFPILQKEADEKAPNGVLEFEQVINYVSAFSPAISKNVILYNGLVVWTVGNGVVYPVEGDTNNYRFVNIKNPITAPDIICNPALPFCSDDGKEIINLDSTGGTDGGKSCEDLYGSFLNQYIPNPNNVNQVCQTTCGSDGILKATNCKNIPNCPTGTLNANYECVDANVPQEGKPFTVSAELLYIIGFFIIAILVMVIIKQRVDRK
jgi:hypothetical protein